MKRKEPPEEEIPGYLHSESTKEELLELASRHDSATRRRLENAPERIPSRFRGYMDRMFGTTPQNYFRDWDFERIRSDVGEWKAPQRFLFFYILLRTSATKPPHTEIGSTHALFDSLRHHSGKLAVLGPSPFSPGSVVATGRRTGETCHIILFLLVSPWRNFEPRDLRRECEKGRGLAGRCRIALLFASEKRIPCIVNEEVRKEGSPMYSSQLLELLETPVGPEPPQIIFATM